jgi:hypothetical protein
MNRNHLISAGEHIYAVRKLGDTYSPEQYLEAVELARAGKAGERYADAVLGPETVTATEEPDPTGTELHEAALKILSAKGKDDYTQAEYLAACDEALGETSLQARLGVTK